MSWEIFNPYHQLHNKWSWYFLFFPSQLTMPIFDTLHRFWSCVSVIASSFRCDVSLSLGQYEYRLQPSAFSSDFSSSFFVNVAPQHFQKLLNKACQIDHILSHHPSLIQFINAVNAYQLLRIYFRAGHSKPWIFVITHFHHKNILHWLIILCKKHRYISYSYNFHKFNTVRWVCDATE